MAVARPPAEIVGAQRKLRKAQEANRAALGALAVLARTYTGDVLGRYEVGAAELLDADDLAAWIAVVRHENPGQPVCVLLLVEQG